MELPIVNTVSKLGDLSESFEIPSRLESNFSKRAAYQTGFVKKSENLPKKSNKMDDMLSLWLLSELFKSQLKYHITFTKKQMLGLHQNMFFKLKFMMTRCPCILVSVKISSIVSIVAKIKRSIFPILHTPKCIGSVFFWAQAKSQSFSEFWSFALFDPFNFATKITTFEITPFW